MAKPKAKAKVAKKKSSPRPGAGEYIRDGRKSHTAPTPADAPRRKKNYWDDYVWEDPSQINPNDRPPPRFRAPEMPKISMKKIRRHRGKVKLAVIALMAATVAVLAAVFGGFGTPGSELMQTYLRIPAQEDRHLFVVKQVAAGNMPGTWNDWVTVKTTSKNKKFEVEFYVSPHGLRLGTKADWAEIPVDGPHAAAIAEILGVKLATLFMAKATDDQARESGGMVKFFALCEIRHSMGDKDCNPARTPDGDKMKAPDTIAEKNRLIRGWISEKGIKDGQLVSGYFKYVVVPIQGLTTRPGTKGSFGRKGKGKTNRLEIYGGYNDQGNLVQKFSGGYHEDMFFDYSQNIRLVKDEVLVNGKSMTMNEFFSNVDHALAFGFQKSEVLARAYRYTPALARWMAAEGHLRSPLTAEE